MVKLLVKKVMNRAEAGLAPGTLQYIGSEQRGVPKVGVTKFSESLLEKGEDWKSLAVGPDQTSDKVLWVNVEGVHEVAVVQQISRHFGLHILTQEEILNTEQRPKVEEYPEYLFLPLKMLYPADSGNQYYIEHISLVLGRGYVLSFQEQSRDVLGLLRRRLEDPDARIRKRKADYLLYAILDAIVSHYFSYADQLEEQIDELEDRIFHRQGAEQLREIQQLQSDNTVFLRYILPLREVVLYFLKADHPMVEERNHVFFRDLLDDVGTIRERAESNRELLRNLRDFYLALNNQRMNEVMKTLTIIATIFIPLTFIAGIYGMNFANMPELQWQNGYFYILGIMGGIFLGMLVYFWRRKWI